MKADFEGRKYGSLIKPQLSLNQEKKPIETANNEEK